MLNHETFRDHAKASIANCRRMLRRLNGKALWNLTPTSSTLLAGSGLGIY